MTAKHKKTGSMDAESRAFYDRITNEYALTTAGLELLRLACCTLTRWRTAAAIIDKEGEIINSGKLPRIHPACRIEHDSRLSFCRMLKELNLDSEISVMET